MSVLDMTPYYFLDESVVSAHSIQNPSLPLQQFIIGSGWSISTLCLEAKCPTPAIYGIHVRNETTLLACEK